MVLIKFYQIKQLISDVSIRFTATQNLHLPAAIHHRPRWTDACYKSMYQRFFSIVQSHPYEPPTPIDKISFPSHQTVVAHLLYLLAAMQSFLHVNCPRHDICNTSLAFGNRNATGTPLGVPITFEYFYIEIIEFKFPINKYRQVRLTNNIVLSEQFLTFPNEFFQFLRILFFQDFSAPFKDSCSFFGQFIQLFIVCSFTLIKCLIL